MIKIKGGGEPIIGKFELKYGVRVTKTPRTVTEIRAASRKVGRPKKPDALTAAERAKAYRERKRNG